MMLWCLGFTYKNAHPYRAISCTVECTNTDKQATKRTRAAHSHLCALLQ